MAIDGKRITGHCRPTVVPMYTQRREEVLRMAQFLHVLCACEGLIIELRIKIILGLARLNLTPSWLK